MLGVNSSIIEEQYFTSTYMNKKLVWDNLAKSLTCEIERTDDANRSAEQEGQSLSSNKKEER